MCRDILIVLVVVEDDGLCVCGDCASGWACPESQSRTRLYIPWSSVSIDEFQSRSCHRCGAGSVLSYSLRAQRLDRLWRSETVVVHPQTHHQRRRLTQRQCFFPALQGYSMQGPNPSRAPGVKSPSTLDANDTGAAPAWSSEQGRGEDPAARSHRVEQFTAL